MVEMIRRAMVEGENKEKSPLDIYIAKTNKRKVNEKMEGRKELIKWWKLEILWELYILDVFEWVKYSVINYHISF